MALKINGDATNFTSETTQDHIDLTNGSGVQGRASHSRASRGPAAVVPTEKPIPVESETETNVLFGAGRRRAS